MITLHNSPFIIVMNLYLLSIQKTHFITVTMLILLGNESKKQRDQCKSSTQYTRVAYNGERELALPLMPLFICVS